MVGARDVGGGKSTPSLLIALFLGCVAHLQAAAPRINHIFPAGCTRGTETVITASGDFSNWPVQTVASHAGIKLAAEQDKGKFKLTVGPDVAPGTYWIRALDREGASSPRPIIVGTLPEVDETESNDLPEKAQSISERVTINGRLSRNGDVDGYAVALRRDQTLIASLQANTDLGAPMDGVLQVGWIGKDATESAQQRPVDVFVMEQNDDTVGIDPRVIFRAPRDGRYLVRVFAFPQTPNSTIGFAGGDNFIYRLTVTTGGFIDHAYPLAIQGGTSANVELQGWNLPDGLRQISVSAPGGGESCAVFHPDLAGVGQLAVTHMPVVLREANDNGSPQRVTIPAMVTGQLQRVRQEDIFVFAATKGKKLRLRVESRTLGFDADPTLRVTDVDGKRLEESDDVGNRRDPEVVFSPPADGEYRAVVRDVHGQAGLRHVYRLSLEEATPDFSLTLANDSFVVAAGKSVEIPLTVDRRDNFAEKIDVYVEGLPAEVSAAPVQSESSGGSAKSVKLVLQAPESCSRFSGPVTIVGVAAAGDRTARKFATYALKDLNVNLSEVWLTVTPKE